LESFSPERLVPVIIQQPEASQHDPNEALDQISADNLTQDAPPDEDEATRTARKARNRHAGFMQLNMLDFLRATSTTNSTTSQTRSSEHQLLR